MVDDLVELILSCIRELGEIEGREELTNANRKSKLFGPAGILDSMGLVRLIVEVEGKISEVYGKDVVLASEKAMSRSTSPFRNVESMATYSAELLTETAQ